MSRKIFAIGLFLLTGLAAAVQAQQDVIPKEVTALISDISDIDKMRVIAPLKFTSDQYGKIAEVISKSLKTYNQKVANAIVPAIQDMAKEIKQVRADVIAGKPIPDGFDKKVKQIETEFVDKRSAEDIRTLKAVAEELRGIFTKSQIESAVKLARTLSPKSGPTLKGTDDQFFNFYVKGTFLEYSGIVSLLNTLKDQPPKTSSTQTGILAGTK